MVYKPPNYIGSKAFVICFVLRTKFINLVLEFSSNSVTLQTTTLFREEDR